jgi:alpha-tubulin suppressor-like RCC1 family protein
MRAAPSVPSVGLIAVVASIGGGACRGHWPGQPGPAALERSDVPVPVVGLSGVTAISAGNLHTCALIAGGAVACWGANEVGELGRDGVEASATPLSVAGLSRASSLSSGESYTCAAEVRGRVSCWGHNPADHLGIPTISSKPVVIPGVNGVIGVAAGVDHTCALLSGGAVQCWGRYFFTARTPTAIPGLAGATAIGAAAFGWHTCALLADASVGCWGRNDWGQLGSGQSPDYTDVPVLARGVSGAIAVAADRGYSCALLTGGRVECWGIGWAKGAASYLVRPPALVPGVSGATAIATRESHACAVLAGGSIRCWAITSGPITIPALSGARALALGGLHACALIVDGSVRCWGDNGFGQLGNGTLPPAREVVPVAGR